MQRLLLVIVAVVTAAGCAFAGVALDLAYDFETGDAVHSRATAKIESVEMGKDVPLAVTGNAAMDLSLEVLRCPEEVATIRATFGEVEATLMDEPQDAGTPGPVELQVDRRGALVGLASDESPEIDLFASGGVPLQFVVLLAGVVEMPDGPVGVGEAWTVERSQQVPEVGEISMLVTSRVTAISASEIEVSTDIEASLPEITTENPMQDGDVTVQNGVLTIEGMKRTIDVDTGLLKSARAVMKFNGFAVVGPMIPLPLTVTSSFEIVPREEQSDG